MKIIERSGTKFLWHCSWHENMTNPVIQERAEKILAKYNIKYITSGICEDCKKVLEDAMDKLTN